MRDVDPDNEATFKVVDIPSTLKAAKRPEQAILAEAQSCGYCEEAIFALKLALEEAMTNAVKHGNRNDASKRIKVRYAVSPQKLVIIVRDQGGGFTPDAVPDPTHPDRIPLPTGRGIMLMRAYMDEVRFRENGAEVYLVKLNQPSASSGE